MKSSASRDAKPGGADPGGACAFTERKIAAWLCRYTFNRKHLVIVPNCSWTGNECDLLVVTPDLRVIDVEIKISRADLRADAGKDKWYHSWDWKVDGPWMGRNKSERRRTEWPRRVWKHYYCLPRAVWKPELLAGINAASGVLLIEENRSKDGLAIGCERRSRPCRDAQRISAEAAVDIARLASLRMWDAYDAVDRMADDAKRARMLFGVSA